MTKVNLRISFEMDKTAKVKHVISKILAYTFLILMAALCLFFFYILIVNSTKDKSELIGAYTPTFGTSFFKNFWNALTSPGNSYLNIPLGLLNSFIVASLTAVVTTYFSALTAYAVHAYDFKGKTFVATFILAIMMIPSQVTSLGFIRIAYELQLTNYLFMLILPTIAAPSVYFYMLQYLKATLPLDLVEASRMDGSSEFMTFNRIVLPIMKPALAVQAIFSFVQSWNNYYMPSLLLKDSTKHTLPIMLGLLRSQQESQADAGQVWMVILISILPVVLVYLVLSKSIIKGVTSGSVKG